MDVNNKISNIGNNNNNNISDILNSNLKKNNVSIEKSNLENNTNTQDNKNNLIDKNSISKESLDKLITEVNNKFKLVNKEFSYEIHEKTNRVTVKIKDSETGDIIKQIPSEESLDLAAKIMEMVGLLIDEKS